MFQKKRTIDDESDFCTEETLNDVLNSKVCVLLLFFKSCHYSFGFLSPSHQSMDERTRCKKLDYMISDSASVCHKS